MSHDTRIASKSQLNFPDQIHREIQSFTPNLPSLLAIVAGIVLASSSAATNAIYGWFRTDLLPYQIIWAAVSIAASGILALGPTALLKALRQRLVAGSIIAGLAIALCGSYSFTAAIGASAGQRMKSAAVQSDDAGTRERLQNTYDATSEELKNLAPSSSVAELDAKIAALKQTPGANNCVKVDGPISKRICPEVAASEVERARAARREELQATMAETSNGLSKLGPAKLANTDAAAIQSYLEVAGVQISVDALNRWLALLAVALVEFGGGLAFALASVLKEPVALPAVRSEAPPSNPPKTKAVDTEDRPKKIDARPSLKLVSNRKTPRKPVAHANFADRMLALVKERGGELYAGHRPLAEALGCSTGHVGNVLRDLSNAGHVTVQATKTGTIVRLAA